MDNLAGRLLKASAYSLTTLSLIAIIVVNYAVAQQGTPGRPPGPPDLKGGITRQTEREAMLRKTELGATAGKKDPKRIEAEIEKLKQDFKQIQVIRNELVRGLLANAPLDYKKIADKVGDINKCADHLKIYLLPPAATEKEKGEKQKVEYKSEEIKDALIQLCNLIAGFVDNPVLKNPGVTDVQQSTRAGNDLMNIIELSSNIKKSAEKLNKVSK